jgi:hypothetical protein
MARRKVESGAEVPSTVLGQTTPEDRAKEIAAEQDAAIARAQARADLEKRAASEQTGAISSAELEAEFAKQKPANPLRDMFAAAGVKTPTNDDLDKAAASMAPSGVRRDCIPGEKPKDAAPPNKTWVHEVTEVGEQFEVVRAEEMYGLKGTFSSYRVGPFKAWGRVGPGETRPQAMRRVLDELAIVAQQERERVREEFMAHLPRVASGS